MPAQAAEVARVDLGSRFGQLLVSPDGGAWLQVASGQAHEIARVRPGVASRARA